MFIDTKYFNNNNNEISYAIAHARQGHELGYNAITILRATLRKPAIDAFPKNWPDFVSQWNLNDLDSFVNCNKQDWDSPALVQRYSKWQRAIKAYRCFKERYDYVEDIEAAGKLEEDRITKKFTCI